MSPGSPPSGFPRGLRTRYQCLAELGSGAMGVVYRARDRELGREVAVKVLLLEPGDEVLARMEREARVMSRIRHPGVVEVYDSGSSGGKPYVVMELLDGSDLESYPPGPGAVPIMLEVAEALEVLHQEGVLHRDLKPANLFRTRAGRVVVTDFGLASAPDSRTLTRTGALIGTPMFLSPEILSGEEQDRRGDWWAWAVSCFWLREGQFPYSFEELVQGARSGGDLPELRFRSTPEGPVRDLLRAALGGDPEARPGSFDEIRILLDPGVSVPPETRTPAPDPSREKRGGGRRLVVGLFLALLWSATETGGQGEGAEGPPIGEPGRAHSLEGVRERAGERLERLGWYYRAPGGKEQRISGKAPPRGWEELLSPDPARWGDILVRFPELASARDWLVRNGARDLPPNLAESLLGVDETFQGQALPRPLFPFLYIRPTEVLVPLESEVRQHFLLGGPRPERARGWAGAAAMAGSRFLRSYEVMRESARRFVEEGGEASPEAADLLHGISVLALGNLDYLQEEVWHRPASRRRSGAWSRSLGESAHALLFAGQQASREGSDEEQRAWAWMVYSHLQEVEWWPYTYLAGLPEDWVLGRVPETPGEFLLTHALVHRQTLVARKLGWPSQALEERSREAIREAIRGALEEGAPRDYLTLLVQAALQSEFRLGSPRELLETFRLWQHHLDLAELPSRIHSLVPLVLWAGQTRDGEPDGLTREELEPLVDFYRRNPEEEEDHFAEIPARRWADWARSELVETP